jgi:putative transposase
VLGMDIGPSEAETFWTAFLRKLARRGLRGVKLVISDAHEGIKAAVSKILTATWQRCRVHFMRNVLAHAGRSGRRVVSAFIATAFAQNDAKAAKQQWRRVADQLRPKVPKLAALMDEAETDVLAYMSFPAQHRAKLHSTDEIDKRFCVRRGTFSLRGRPRGEARRVGWKRRRAACIMPCRFEAPAHLLVDPSEGALSNGRQSGRSCARPARRSASPGRVAS